MYNILRVSTNNESLFVINLNITLSHYNECHVLKINTFRN